MAGGPIKLTLQGVDAQWRANNRPEALEVGPVDEAYFLQVLQFLTPQPHPANVPITVHATGPAGRVTFLVGNNRIEEHPSRTAYTGPQAVQRVLGAAPQAAAPAPAPAPAVASGGCAKCGAAMTPDMRFCGSCGAPKQAAAPPTCPGCKSLIKPGLKFCTTCGTKLA